VESINRNHPKKQDMKNAEQQQNNERNISRNNYICRGFENSNYPGTLLQHVNVKLLGSSSHHQ
jgi:hypothetical protein